MEEKWVDLNCGDIRKNYYEISNHGRIRLKSSKKILKTFISNTGYERLGLATETKGKKRNYSVHRLVAETFMPVKFKGQDYVNHKDGDKLNNYVKNLERVSQSENNIHAYDNGLAYTKVEHHHFNKYSDELIHSICKLLEKGKETYDIIVELNLVDMNKYSRSSPEYKRIKNVIKVLRRKKFRRDIISLYDF